MRRIPELNAKKLPQPTLFDTHRFHAFFTTSSLDTVTADQVHRQHAIIEQVNADLKHTALAHLPSGIFTANAAWLVVAVITFNLTRTTATLTGAAHASATTATPTPASTYQQLRQHLSELKLANAADALPLVLDQAAAENWTLTRTLEHLLRVEVTATDARRLAGRFRFANLPTGATLNDFDHDAASGVDRSLLAELGTCRYIDTATNVLLIGPPGVGKTHIATGLGHAAVTAGYRVYFASAADLAARCHRAAIEGKWATMTRFFAGPTLLISTSSATSHSPGEAASALFQSSTSAT